MSAFSRVNGWDGGDLRAAARAVAYIDDEEAMRSDQDAMAA
jgi:hypothetical protein